MMLAIPGIPTNPPRELALLQGGGFDGEEHESALIQGAVQSGKDR